MANRLIAVSFLLLFLAGCSNNPPIKEAKGLQQDTVVTDDGEVTFKIFNAANVPAERVDAVKKELLEAYDDIKQTIQTDYTPSKKINIHLLEGREFSKGLRADIKLYGVRNGSHPLVHELTHTLLGYGDNSDSSRGYLSQEGFAVYMENRFGKQKYPIHKVMKLFLSMEKSIPLNKLIDLDNDDSLFRPAIVGPDGFAVQEMSYYHAASFVTYLIDTYGLEKFEKVYDQPNLGEKLVSVYGKNVDELEREWLSYIEKNYNEPETEEKMKIENFYTIVSSMDSIDQQIFQR
ncbi:hypothetical protein [Neobacillus sp. YIM B06451]|uniref:hypothetical protein n=1 Tax=Neobacillus sp. YIM B06451 TaxID=3070994 RepID=UPI0029309965|nr:hypothetical protein [Neobacillus sp. YIM B06451]